MGGSSPGGVVRVEKGMESEEIRGKGLTIGQLLRVGKTEVKRR